MASRFPSSGSPPNDQVDLQRLRRLRQYTSSDSEAQNVVEDSLGLDPSDVSRLRRLRLDTDTSGDSFDRQIKRRMRRLQAAAANSSERVNDLEEFELRFNRYRGMKNSPSNQDAGWYPRRRVSSARSRMDGGLSPASSVSSFHSLPTHPASSYATVDGEPMADDDVFDNSPVGVPFTRPRSDSHQYFADRESYSPGSHASGRSKSLSRTAGSQAASRRWDRYYRDSGSSGSPSNADLRSIMVDIPTYDTSPSRYLDASVLSPSNRLHVTFDPSMVSTPMPGASPRPYTFQTLDPSALDMTSGYTNYAYSPETPSQYFPSSDPRTDDSMRPQYGNYTGRPVPNPSLPYSPMDDIERDILAHNRWVGRARVNPVQNEYPCPSPRPIRPPQPAPGTPQPYRGTLGRRWDPRGEQFNLDMPSSDSDTQGPNCRCANPCSRTRSTCNIL